MNKIDQRIYKLRSHQNLSAFYESLPFHTRQIVESFLETGANYPLMEKASQCMDAEFQANPILQILAHGNVLLLDAVTEVALDDIEYRLSAIDDEKDE